LNGEISITTGLEGPAIDSLREREQAILERMRQRGERGIWMMNYFSDFVPIPTGSFIIAPQGFPILHEIDKDGNLQRVYRLKLAGDSPFDDFAIHSMILLLTELPLQTARRSLHRIRKMRRYGGLTSNNEYYVIYINNTISFSSF